MNAKIRRPGTAVALMLGLIACRYQPTPVVLQGAPGDIARLAGTWEGEFTGIESRRSGTIVLTIQAGKDTAYQTGRWSVARESNASVNTSRP